MEILIFLAVIVVAGQVTYRRTNWNSGWHDTGFIGSLVAGVFLAAALLTVPVSRMDIMAGVAKFNAVRDSRELAAGTPEIEAAAWRMKVAESNAWLAETNYYNGTIFDIWIPDSIASLKPIK